MIRDPLRLLPEARSKSREIKRYFDRLKTKKPPGLDELASRFHEEVFAALNCTDCANCCRTLGPRLRRKDIEGISSALGMRPAAFGKVYLKEDEDGDLVFKTLPCPFLEGDGRCGIYEHRPEACRGYPHTDERVHSLLSAACKNVFICPGAYLVFERIRKELPL